MLIESYNIFYNIAIYFIFKINCDALLLSLKNSKQYRGKMQIHTEAHLARNINTSISEFAMKTVPPSTSYHSGSSFSCGQHRMESLGLNRLHFCAIKHHVWRRWIGSGWDPESNTAGGCHLAPSSLWEAGCQLFQSDSFFLFVTVPIYLLFIIHLFIFFFARNVSISLGS